MSAWGYMPPASVLAGDKRTVDSLTLPFTGTIVTDDILIISSGVLAKAATNAAVTTLAGMALFGSSQIYYAAAPTIGKLFGVSTVGTALTPGIPLQLAVNPLYGGSFLQMSNVVAWNPGTNDGPGTAVGLTLDGTTGFFVADSGQSNKIGKIVRVVINPAIPFAVGDTGVRVIVQINAATALGG